MLMEIPDLVRSATDETVRASMAALSVAMCRAPGGPGHWWTQEARQAFPDAIGHEWDWAKFAKGAQYRVTHAQCACLLVEHHADVQGCILLRWDTTAATDGSRALGVANVAVAPWNRRHDKRAARFTRVGTAMMLFAVVRSYELGFGGRLVLEAADFPPTLAFYQALGLTLGNRTANTTVLMYLDSESAHALLTRFGYGF
jgi:hypothetical protein